MPCAARQAAQQQCGSARTKSGESFLEEVNSEGRARDDEDVHAQVELEAVDEQRLWDVLLHDHALQVRHVLDVPRQEDALALHGAGDTVCERYRSGEITRRV
eukprot:3707019-Pleurochrysis_carterae.AAC.1